MSTFLKELATRLLDDYSNDLSQLVVMFPSLRARTFFNDAIEQVSSNPTWQPHYTTIDDLMVRGSGLEHGERIRLISELFTIYHEKFPSEEFDHFYYWGDMLISDFDMIDKYLVDANMLLRNIEDIKEIESDVSYLTEEQERILQHIKRFWSSVHTSESLSAQKKRFLEVWKALPEIYERYRARLIELKIGYPGLLYRITAERIIAGEDIDLEPKRHIIAGFNALSKSEQILFKHIAKSDMGAEFYWDYDDYYVAKSGIEEHEAGIFLRNNIKDYPCNDPLSHSNFTKIKKQLSATACVSNISQVKHIGKILKSIPESEWDKNTAIVLTDENLLIPLLHSLPESVKNVNVTMGYPLRNSLTYSFIEALITLQTHSHSKEDRSVFYHKDVTWLLTHPYIVDSCGERAANYANKIVSKRITTVDSALFADDDVLSLIFTSISDWESLGKYLVNITEAIMQRLPEHAHDQHEHLRIMGEEIAKTMRSAKCCNIEIPTKVFISLLRRHLQTVTIPYKGEPLEGIQVLGILETRNVDFKNVIILSMTDANFPGNHTDQASFIPYSLRYAYDMPTPEQHEAMYAYYFYRLIQRAERVNMLYCSRADEKSTGECSRYIYQLDFESPYSVEKHAVGVDLSIEDESAIEVAKGKSEMEALMRYADANTEDYLSPTALFRYVECPLKFYFASIAHLRARNELSDKIDALGFGDILHKAMELLYKRNNVVDTKNPMQIIKGLQSESIVESVVDEAIGMTLYKDAQVTAKEFSGDTLLVRDIIVKYIHRGIMRYDTTRKGFTVTALEKKIHHNYEISSGLNIKLSGIADRIDTLPDGTLQVIDYKSGYQPHLEFNSVETLFTGSAKQRISNIFQTLLYSMVLHKNEGVDTLPTLFYASRMLNDSYSPIIKELDSNRDITRYSLVASDFEARLKALLDELFDPSTPFRQVEDRDTCTRCDYNRICRR
ncbi:MAG: PD-(D/E)XK nuclease family protein [Alistipes sp.]|nr:PD-(D/E)XK nuclease family protein [Alistipes sp.]